MKLRACSRPIAAPLGDRTAMGRLAELPPYRHSASDRALFTAALRASAAVHMRRCPEFAGLWKAEGFRPADLRSWRDTARMPHIVVAAFKERGLVSAAKKEAVLEMTSSGTSGQRSRIVFDRPSLLRLQRQAWQVFNGMGLAAGETVTDYLCFTYDPAVAKNVGTAFSDESITGLTLRGEVFYALRWDAGKKDFYFDLEGSVAALERFERSGRPARLVGFPAHAMAVCEEFARRHGRAARLHPGSRVITGGGWKDKQDRAVDKSEMRGRLARALGLPAEHVRDLFGMVEHGVPYVDCRLGNFHIPVYSRVIARHPATLRALPCGETGLLQFIAPYLTSYPSISLLSSDRGWIEKKCPCGLGGEVLHIAGRAGVTRMKGCAVSAASTL